MMFKIYFDGGRTAITFFFLHRTTKLNYCRAPVIAKRPIVLILFIVRIARTNVMTPIVVTSWKFISDVMGNSSDVMEIY